MMIILRQRDFSFGGFDWWFDSNGNEKKDLSDEDKRKLEALKKKYSEEWNEFERRKSGGNNTSHSSGGSYQSRRSSNSSSSGNSHSSNSSSSYSSGSSSSSSSSSSDWYTNWKRKWDEQQKKWKEEDERFQREAEERHEKWNKFMKGREKDEKEYDKASNIVGLANSVLAGKVIGREISKQSRKSIINSKVGYDPKMKNSDRRRIEDYKKMTKGDKELLKKIASEKDPEKVKKIEKKYKLRKTTHGAIGKAVSLGAFGSSVGFLYDDIKVTKDLGKEISGNSKASKRTLKGLGIGALGGSVIGGTYNAIKASNNIKKIKNSKDKEREKDRIKVGSGKMTEYEFVNKYGGRN